MGVSRHLAFAAILSLAVSACGGESLPSTPTVPPASAPLPAPSSGYRVMGYVRGPGSVPVAGARVEAPATEGNGNIVRQVGQTDGSGFFVLYGLNRHTPFLVTAQGFRPSVRSFDVTDNLSLTFDLTPSLFTAGPHRLTISAAAECRDALPEIARTRTYTALIEDEFDSWWEGASYLSVTLSGANFRQDSRGRHNTFEGFYQQDSAEFLLSDYDGLLYSGTPRVVEQLTPSTALVIVGHAKLSGTLEGGMYVVSIASGQDPDYQNHLAVCWSKAHQFVLSR